MPYIPKSQLNFLYTSEGLIHRNDGTPYKGPYMLTSEGKYYTGHDNINIGRELIVDDLLKEKRPLDLPLEENEKYFSFVKEVRKYNRVNKSIKDFLEFKKKLPSSKPRPTKIDCRKGYFRRYFTKRINADHYFEIDKKTYEDIKDKKGKYDYNLYEVGEIIWVITGNRAYEANSIKIKKLQKKYKNLFNLFPILNEYLKEPGEVRENLYTSGGELYYSNGTEFIGNYHIHPEKGPMEGNTHTSEPHANLYYFNSLPAVQGQSYESFLQNYNKIDCYKCIQVNKFSDPQIVTNKRSSLLGCPENSFSTYEEALASCPQITNTTDNVKESGF